jgi:hypothetical protein
MHSDIQGENFRPLSIKSCTVGRIEGRFQKRKKKKKRFVQAARVKRQGSGYQ